jgi:hypothetical protein
MITIQPLLIFLSSLTCAFSQIFVSDNLDKFNSVPLLNLYNTTCLSGLKYVFLNTDFNDPDNRITKVTWYTKKNTCDIERYNNKTNYFPPFDFKGGKLWDTNKVHNDFYFMYANVYFNNTIAYKFRNKFCICNNVTECDLIHPPKCHPTTEYPTTEKTTTEKPTLAPTLAPTTISSVENILSSTSSSTP